MWPLANIWRWTSVLPLLVLGLAGGGAEATDRGSAGPELILDGGIGTTLGVPVLVPMDFLGHDSEITAIAFSLDLDLASLAFDPSDGDGDGIPDAVSFPFVDADLTVVSFDAIDEDGELDVLLAELSGIALPDGLLMEIELLPTRDGWVASWIRFSQDPAPSFGDTQGQDVPGSAVVTGAALFADGFETGDFSGWSAADP